MRLQDTVSEMSSLKLVRTKAYFIDRHGIVIYAI